METDKKTIFIIDDDKALLAMISMILKKEGYSVEIFTSGRPALEQIRLATPDLVILDLILPDINGMEICAIIKKNINTRKTPIIMLTARNFTKEMVKGLKTGADDYIVKPFDPDILLARIEAIFRRILYNGRNKQIINIGEVSVDETGCEVKVDNEIIPMTVKEFKILYLFMERAGEVISKETFLNTIWGSKYVNSRNVDVYICNIRKKLGKAGIRIKTVPYIGYKFLTEV